MKEITAPRAASSSDDRPDLLAREASESYRRGDLELAVEQLQALLEQQPMNYEANCDLGTYLFESGFLAASAKRFERALLIKPGSGRALYSLALVQMRLHQLPEAGRSLSQLLEREPDHLEGSLALANVEQLQARGDGADAIYRQAMNHHPNSGRLWHARAMQQKWQASDPGIADMLAALETGARGSQEAELFAYALGKIHDDLGDYSRAMEAYRQANQMQSAQQSYDYPSQVAFFSRHREWQSREKLAVFDAVASGDTSPVFVIGMPRSGTSLVEQILGAHSQVAAAGEVAHSRLLATRSERFTERPFPENVDTVEPADMAEAGGMYLERLRASVACESRPEIRIVDKLPHNFLRVGLLATLFPRASFVLCERDPMDVCLSIYRQWFSGAHAYACDLVELGRYYRLYQELIQFWEAQYPGRLYRLSYEKLVADSTGQVRQLLEALHLPFEAACLDSHTSFRFVATPSAAQVRQPIYRGGVGHWRHYQQWLAPLQEALENRGA